MTYENYIKKSEGIEVQDALVSRIPAILKVLEQVTEQGKWDYAYAADKWTVKQVVQHLIDCERVFSYRALHIARKDTTVLLGFDENMYADQSVAEQKEIRELIEEYLHVMQGIYYQFKGYTSDIMRLEANVSDYHISIEHIGRVIYGHSFHHLSVLQERYLDAGE
ncbi:MAG: DinB family protein [Flavobacteriaceae bacterium]|jgi:hypothetical protein|nr:DinB family protein [Flavobacteriaceae bacterium]